MIVNNLKAPLAVHEHEPGLVPECSLRLPHKATFGQKLPGIQAVLCRCRPVVAAEPIRIRSFEIKTISLLV